MAHYAVLDENNIVTQVFVGKDETEPCPKGFNDWEQYYGAKRTSYNTYGNVHNNGETPFRKNYAGIGYTYDPIFDGFYAPKAFPSWKLNYETFLWEAPIARPEDEDGFVWRWSEPNKEWIKQPHLPGN
jgi:hypothetical protein